MRESFGTTWVFQIVVVLIFLFSIFLSLSIRYSKVFKLKNELLLIMEKYDGVTNESLEIMNNYLSMNNYSNSGTCESETAGSKTYGFSDLEGSFTEAVSGNKYYYCITIDLESNNQSYYNLTLFFGFNLPVVGDVFKYRINGTTKSVDYGTWVILH